MVRAHSSASCVTQPPSLWFGWAPGKGHTTEREHPWHPVPSSCSPSTGARFDCLQATKIHRQAGIQFARPSFHPPLVPTACCIHNPLDSFRGSQLSARLPLLFKTLGISAKDMFWLDPLLWPLHISGKLSYKKHSPGSRKRKEGIVCLNTGPYKRNVLQGPGAHWTSDQHLPKTVLLLLLLLLNCFSRVQPCATP